MDKIDDSVLKTVAQMLAEHTAKIDQRLSDFEKTLDKRTNVEVDQFIHDVRVRSAFKGDAGVAGKDADSDLICERLKADSAFIQRCKGEAGKAGKDGESVELEAVVSQVLASDEFIKRCTGPAGIDSDPAEVAKLLASDPAFVGGCKPPMPSTKELVYNLIHDSAFIEKVRGKNGRDGKDGESPAAHEVAESLAKDAEFIAACKGQDGHSIEPIEVATILAADENFLAACKGADGQDGKDAHTPDWQEVTKQVTDLVTKQLAQDDEFVQQCKGEDGKDCEALDVALALAQNKEFIEAARGPRGLDALPEDVAEIVLRDNEFAKLCTGPQGERGEPGVRGRKGMKGTGISEILYADDQLIITLSDDREPFTVDLKSIVKEVMQEMRVI